MTTHPHFIYVTVPLGLFLAAGFQSEPVQQLPYFPRCCPSISPFAGVPHSDGTLLGALSRDCLPENEADSVLILDLVSQMLLFTSSRGWSPQA